MNTMLKLNKDTILRDRKMQFEKFVVAALAAIIILSAIIVHSLLTSQFVIHNSGTIGTVTTSSAPLIAYQSEIRFAWMAPWSFDRDTTDWDVVAQTSKNYNIDTIIAKMFGLGWADYNSSIIPHKTTRDELALGIQATHSRGMKFHAAFSTLHSTFPSGMGVIHADGTEDTEWADPTNPDLRALIKSLLEEVTTNYDLDGLMFDYLRYESDDVPYGQYAKAKFEEYLGETIADSDWAFPGQPAASTSPFIPGGSRYKEFMEWRVHAIDELMRDMRSWVLAANPNVEISAVVFGWVPGYPTYNRYWIGQDFVAWAKDGLIDFVATMMYNNDLTWIEGWVKDYEAALGGPDGIIPHISFLSHCSPEVGGPGGVSVSDWTKQIDLVRSLSDDGWTSWAYGGPGQPDPRFADYTEYLNAVSMPPIFSLNNITASATQNSVTITWTTNLPATSKVEYSTSPLFNATLKYDPVLGGGFNYWDIDHVPGTIVEDTTPVTNHSVTLTGLTTGILYYYRVQSQDSSGIATSKVYTFQL